MMRFFVFISVSLLLCSVNIARAELIAHWTFDEGSGVAFQDSVGTNHAQAKGNAGAGWIQGKVGASAYDFTGNSYSDFPTNTSTGTIFNSVTNQITITYWEMGNPIVTSSGNVVLGNGGNAYYIGSPNVGSGVLFGTANWANNVTWVPTGGFDWQEWNHFAFTKDSTAGVMRMYVNGNLVASNLNAYAALDQSGWFESWQMNAAIDDMRIYNHVLSQAEISRLNNAIPPCYAYAPSPADDAGIIGQTQTLGWTAAEEAESHNVYFGTDFNDVNNADIIAGDVNSDGAIDYLDLKIFFNQWLQDPNGMGASADFNNDNIVNIKDFAILAGNWNKVGAFKGNHDANTYNISGIEPGQTYYWRIDEVTGENICKGDVWRFMVSFYSENPTPYVERLELAASNGLGGDSGNSWGGHQNKIVRTETGVFTAYAVNGTGTYSHTSNYDREWRLAKRTGINQWSVIASGPSGREPVNLLAAPNGNLYIVAWPNMVPHIWVFQPSGALLTQYDIPGTWYAWDWPYNCAGISANGDIVIVESVYPDFYWTYYTASSDQWQFHTTQPVYRHCYNYIFAGLNGEVSWVDTIDVVWSELGLCKPPGWYHDFVFNSCALWHTPNQATTPVSYLKIKEAVQQACEPVDSFVYESYKDTAGRTHVLYQYIAEETNGMAQMRHALIQDGVIVKDAAMPEGLSRPRMFQDSDGRIFIIGVNKVYPAMSEDGMILGEPEILNFPGYNVGVMYLAAPRGGTPAGEDFIDGAFAAAEDNGPWVYFRVRIR